MKKSAVTSIKLNHSFLISFARLFNLYWLSQEKRRAIFFLIIATLLTIGAVKGSVMVNTANKDFFDALQVFNMPLLISSFIPFSLGVLIWIGSTATAFYCKELLAAKWRMWLTKHHLAQWFNQHRHYHLKMNNCVDNPDQRISEDLESFPELTIGLFFLLLNFALNIGTYSYILCSISNTFVFHMASRKFTIHGYLFWCALVYGILSIYFTQKIGNKLSVLDFIKERLGANFRFSLVRSREFSEQIALLNDGARETDRLTGAFSKIYANSLKIINLRTKINFCNGFFAGSGAIVGSLAALPLFFSKQIQIGTLMQISGAFAMVLSAFSMLAQSFDVFAQWKTVVFRLTQFKDALDQPNGSHNLQITHHDQPEIKINNLTVCLPNGECLIEQLNLTFNQGMSYLIQDPSGSGKSVFLRTLAGIWPHAQGEIFLPNNKSMYFLPQKPYFPHCSLIEILLPDHSSIEQADELKTILEQLNLQQYLTDLDTVKDWQNILSGGEQQRMFLAQVLIQRPDIIFLDEATSALDPAAEINFYQLLTNTLPTATIISVGHRESLVNFHQHTVKLANKTRRNMRADELSMA